MAFFILEVGYVFHYFFPLDWLAHLELNYSVVNTPWWLYADLGYAFLIRIDYLKSKVVVWAPAKLASDYLSGFVLFWGFCFCIFFLLREDPLPGVCINWLCCHSLCAGPGMLGSHCFLFCQQWTKKAFDSSCLCIRTLGWTKILTHSFHVGPFPGLWPFPLLSFRHLSSGPGFSWRATPHTG